MEKDLISIVVPIYNVEKYLKKCIDSIISQTYTNLEIILIDDGSPDNCGKICDEYAQKDSRIKVIHKENAGVSQARNVGLDNASGKYITFVDSDDYIECEHIENLYNALKENNTQISQCNILKVNDKKEVLEKLGYKESQIKSTKEILKESFGQHWVENAVVWNKIYDKKIFEGIRYPIGKIHEDEFVIYKVLYKVDKIALINEYSYNYRKNKNSIMGRRFNVERFDILNAFEERLKFFQERREVELYQTTMIAYLKKMQEYYLYTKKYIEKSENIQLDLIKKYRKNYKKILKYNTINTIKKIKMLLFYIAPKMYYIIKINSL